jgi:hypothetical protein
MKSQLTTAAPGTALPRRQILSALAAFSIATFSVAVYAQSTRASTQNGSIKQKLVIWTRPSGTWP